MNKSEIDSTQRQLIDNAIQSAFPDKEWRLLEALGGGLSTSQLYKLEVDKQICVARLSDPADPHNNLVREYDAMKLAAEQDLAPTVFHADAQTGVALIGFVEGLPLHTSLTDGTTFMHSLAKLNRTLHQGHRFQKDMPLTAKVEFVFKQMAPDLAATELVKNAMMQMRMIEPLLNDPDDERPSHCDINPGNLLFDGERLWLIDWAAAAQESFYFDLACCSNFFFYRGVENEQLFLQTYFERPLTKLEQEKYARMRTFVHIYYGIMFLYISGMQGARLLAQKEIDSLPMYAQFMSSVGQGKERMDNPKSQQRLGLIYLRMVPLAAQKL